MEIQYRTFSANDIRKWLLGGESDGLSESVISKVRAYSLIHNPYVKDDSTLAVAAFDGNKVVGFTAVFPEHYVRPDIWVANATTLYADPAYADEFIGYYVSKAIHDNYKDMFVIGSDIAPATVIIDRMLGLVPLRYERRRYIMNRKIEVHSLRNFGSLILEPLRKSRQRRNLDIVRKSIGRSIRIEYASFIDESSYRFITDNSGCDQFLRSRESLNWLISYPFRVEAPLIGYVTRRYEFSSHCQRFDRQIVNVYQDDRQIGLFMLAVRGNCAHILLLYASESDKEQVFAMVIEHVRQLNVELFRSQYKAFNSYMDSVAVSLKDYREEFIYTHPKDMAMDQTLQLQGADGDMFA